MDFPGDSAADLHRDTRAVLEGDSQTDSCGDSESDFPADSHRDSKTDSRRDLQRDFRGDFDGVLRAEAEGRSVSIYQFPVNGQASTTKSQRGLGLRAYAKSVDSSFRAALNLRHLRNLRLLSPCPRF